MNAVVAQAAINFSESDAGGANSAKTEVINSSQPSQRSECLRPIGGRAFGLLASIQPDEDCQLAKILTRTGERLIVLPEDLDLREHVSHRIGICRIEEQYHIRRLP